MLRGPGIGKDMPYLLSYMLAITPLVCYFCTVYVRNFSTMKKKKRTTRGRSEILDRRVWKEVIKLARVDKTCRKSNELIGNCFSEHGRVIR